MTLVLCSALGMSDVRPQPHHVRGVECQSRPLYRRGRRATAVKVFTIAHESTHLLIFGVPAINLQEELAKLVEAHGQSQIFKVGITCNFWIGIGYRSYIL